MGFASGKRPAHRSGRDGTLPLRNPYISAKETRAPSIRVNLQRLTSRRRLLAIIGVVAVLLLLWISGVGRSSRRERLKGGPRVFARNWEDTRTTAVGHGSSGAHYNQTVLVCHPKLQSCRDHDAETEVNQVLCPMKNSIEHIWHFFHQLDSLSYPRHLIQLGILVSDSTDRTYERALELADERQYSRPAKQRYSAISIYQKDFAEEMDFHSKNVGAERHDFGLQVARRKVLAVSRTWLLNSAMRPDTDWVLWMDVDVVDYDKDLVQTLLGWSDKSGGDVVVPNCVWKTYNEMGCVW